MADYSEIERMVKSVLYSSGVVFYLDANTLKFNGDAIYTPDSAKGQTGTRGPQGTHGEKGDKGEKGDIGPRGPKGDSGGVIIPDIRCTVSIDNNTSIENPTCTVTKTGSSASPIFNFTFAGLKGIDGKDGKDGVNGKDGKDGENGINGLDADNELVLRLIATVENKVNLLKTRIDNFLSSVDNEIKNKVLSIVDTSEWWQLNFPSGGGSVSNFGLNDVKEYLQTLGLWFENDNATYTKWSTIKLEVGSLRAEVNLIKLSGNSNNMESLAGELYTYLTGDTITSGLLSTWSKFLKLGEDNIEMLEWITSGVRAQTNSEEGVAQLFAAAQGLGQNAYAGIDARVKTIENSYVSETNLSTKVNDSINTIILESTRYSSLSEMSSSVDDSISGISTEVDSKLKTAISNMFAKGESGTAAISAIVDDNNKLTHIQILADQINVFDSNNKEVARISNQGRCSFNLGRVFIPTTVLGIDGNLDNNATGIFIKEVSNGELTGKKAYYEGNGFNVQSNNGSIYCSVANTSNRNIELVSYLDSTDKYSRRITFAVDSKNSTTNAPRILAYVAPSLAEACGGNYGTFETNMSIICPEINLSSDESLKNIISKVNLSVEDISEVRIINYTFKDLPRSIKSGTIAQDWRAILPNTVKVIDSEGHLGLDYSSAALVSSVVDAREIVKLKQENEQLKQRLALIEEKLSKIQ